MGFIVRAFRSTRVAIAATAAMAVSVLAANAWASVLDRDEDPVILEGVSLSAFLGEDPASIVAFRYQSGWVQIPVQVDERDVIDFGMPYDTTDFGISFLAYTDAGTFTGGDSDPTFDANDELVFMGKDAGDERASAAVPEPGGVLPNSRVEVAVTDPLQSVSAYVYLFVTDGSLAPDAGVDYVTYQFVLLSGDYKSTYGILSGPNPENSTIVTDYYRVHFSDRWIRDEVNVKTGSATQVDILDRHKNLFGPGNCSRSEDTFSGGEGCFIANIDGPVRAIRSYLGANSGPFTQREHHFYERRQDVTTYLRVHAISGVMDFYDYSPDASGMTYYNDLNTGGVTVDGDPAGDVVAPGAIHWEMVTGAQGTLVMAERLSTDIPGFGYTSYYSDDSTPSVTQCTGDAFEYGAGGPWVNQPIPNTDPYLGAHNHFAAVRTVYYEAPDKTVERAQALAARMDAPLGVYIPTVVAGGTPPPTIALWQNEPNPFNGRTTIRFRVPEGSRPALSVYDARGRVVTMLDSVSPSGGAVAEVTWDGTDARGNRVPSGIYFYRLTVGRRTAARKMALIE